jgi:hypothetical protein
VGVSESPGGIVRLEFFSGKWAYCWGLCGGGAMAVGGGAMAVGGGAMAVGGGAMAVGGGAMAVGGGALAVGGQCDVAVGGQCDVAVDGSYTRRVCHGSHAHALIPFFNQKNSAYILRPFTSLILYLMFLLFTFPMLELAHSCFQFFPILLRLLLTLSTIFSKFINVLFFLGQRVIHVPKLFAKLFS